MFLKSLEIFGFKSFPDRSRIEFLDGITALLGPNGCGKSNVVDAVKWVLGEQSSKSLRAEKMEDVIFSGTENRKPLNVAEVVLTFSNDSGMLPLDVSEVEVKRRLYRSGESEYFINNTPAKLKELKELFFDTGVGKSAYSIMEQGKIDQVLSNKPEDRRFIFEEAAGITKYKIRSAEAERKLEKTEENMQQAESILSEVKRSYDSLKKQADKTDRYKELRRSLFETELDIALLKLRGFFEEKHAKEVHIEGLKKKEEDLSASISHLTSLLEEKAGIITSMEARRIENQQKLYRIGLDIENKKNLVRNFEERCREIDRQIEAYRGKEKSVKDKILALHGEIDDKEKLLKNIDERLKETAENIKRYKAKIGAAAEQIARNDRTAAENEKEIFQEEKNQKIYQEDLKKITEDIVRELDKELKETGYTHTARERAEETLVHGLEELKIILRKRLQLIEDELKINASGNYDKLAESVKETLSEGIAKAAEIYGSFAEYKKTVPVFIDEFLSPEGIIIKKREIDSMISDSAEKASSLRLRIKELHNENRELAKNMEAARQIQESLKVEEAGMMSRSSFLTDSIKRLRKNIDDFEVQIKENSIEIGSCSQKKKETEKKIKDILDEEKKLSDMNSGIIKDLAKLEQGISKHNSYLTDREKSVRAKKEDLEQVKQQMIKLNVSHATIETEIRNIYENFRENNSKDLRDYEAGIYEIKTSAKELRDKLLRSKNDIKNLGQINLLATEEFAEVKERFDSLTAQMEDLKTAREELRKITKEIKNESEELFLKTFDQIKKNFLIIFRRLFNGGRAELKIIDDSNILVSGIDIYARPPGKKLENIVLLSGGERTLTAVALLFATFMVKPSPFCILDEIDAALDENNVGNFINLLMEFGSKSQFVIITHNKKTVTGAKTFLGVTMEESGVSKIISFHVNRNENDNVS